MTKQEKNILSYVGKNPGKRARAIAIDLDMDRVEVNRLLYRLQELEYVRQSADYNWYPGPKQPPKSDVQPKSLTKKPTAEDGVVERALGVLSERTIDLLSRRKLLWRSEATAEPPMNVFSGRPLEGLKGYCILVYDESNTENLWATQAELSKLGIDDQQPGLICLSGKYQKSTKQVSIVGYNFKPMQMHLRRMEVQAHRGQTLAARRNQHHLVRQRLLDAGIAKYPSMPISIREVESPVWGKSAVLVTQFVRDLLELRKSTTFLGALKDHPNFTSAWAVAHDYASSVVTRNAGVEYTTSEKMEPYLDPLISAIRAQNISLFDLIFLASRLSHPLVGSDQANRNPGAVGSAANVAVQQENDDLPW